MQLKYGITFLVIIWLIFPMTTHSAFAVSTEVAKKCQSLSAKAFPPRVPGNPAAGLMHGTGREAAEYFKKCAENGGKVEESGQQHDPEGAK